MGRDRVYRGQPCGVCMPCHYPCRWCCGGGGWRSGVSGGAISLPAPSSPASHARREGPATPQCPSGHGQHRCPADAGPDGHGLLHAGQGNSAGHGPLARLCPPVRPEAGGAGAIVVLGIGWPSSDHPLGSGVAPQTPRPLYSIGQQRFFFLDTWDGGVCTAQCQKMVARLHSFMKAGPTFWVLPNGTRIPPPPPLRTPGCLSDP